MEQLNEIDRSTLRVASLMLQHCKRFRLMPHDQEPTELDALLPMVSALLDQFEEQLILTKKDAGIAASAGIKMPGGKEQYKKQSVALWADKS